MNFNLLAISTATLEQMLMLAEDPRMELASFIGQVIFWLVGHIFLSISIYYMTKKQGYKKLWLSFIPLVNLIPLGKLLGKTVVWGKTIKNVGVWACIFCAISTVVNFLLNIGYYLSLAQTAFGVTFVITNDFLYSWIMGTNAVAMVISYVSLIFDLGYIFFYVSLVFLTFRLYNPGRAFLYAILSVFIDPLFGIFLFVSRKNPRYIVVHRQPPQGGYYGGGYYGGGYYNGNPQNFNNNQNQNQNQKPENPFPEFGEGENKSTDTGDDFFN
jgi:hypothetical protein